jgi:hypothetical protein
MILEPPTIIADVTVRHRARRTAPSNTNNTLPRPTRHTRAPQADMVTAAYKQMFSVAVTNRVSSVCRFFIGLSASPYAKLVPERRRSGQHGQGLR